MQIKPEEIRAARAYLRRRGVGSAEIPPRRFAAAAKETGKTFSELLRLIARLYQGRQNSIGANAENLSQISSSN